MSEEKFKEMKKRYKKPFFMTEEEWDKYLKSIVDFGATIGKAFVQNITKAFDDVNKKEINANELELVQDKEENEE